MPKFKTWIHHRWIEKNRIYPWLERVMHTLGEFLVVKSILIIIELFWGYFWSILWVSGATIPYGACMF